MKLGFDWPCRTLLTKDNGKQTTDNDPGVLVYYKLTLTCEPDGLGKLKTYVFMKK